MLLFHSISKQDNSYRVQSKYDFKQLREGLGHDCYLDIVQSYGLDYYLEFTALHLGQHIAHTQSNLNRLHP